MAGVVRAVSRASNFVATIALVAALPAALLWLRAPIAPTGGPADVRLQTAATALEAALGPTGDGIRFEITQYQILKARPNGKRIEVPHPIENKTIGLADEYFLSSLAERGVATADGFWSEIRAGEPPDVAPNWNAQLLFAALQSEGKIYRDDGRGWYATTTPPGIGLDPTSVRLLPRLLAEATAAADAPAEKLGDRTLPAVSATGRLADVPGVIAADGAAFTRLQGPMTFAFDDVGRLAKLEIRALNTNMTDFDLVVETTITIAYDDIDDLPTPTPLFDGKVEVRP